MLFFSAGSLGARHSIPERIFLRGSFGFCMPGSYAVYVRAAGLQLQIPLPSVLQERFPGSVVEFREILLRKDSVIEKAEYRQSIAGAVQTVILIFPFSQTASALRFHIMPFQQFIKR